MSMSRNLSAAWQVIRSLPGRTLLLALPVAAGTALALATLAIDQGLTSRAEQAARSFGLDVISIRPGSRIIAGKSGTVTSLVSEDVDALRAELRRVKAVEGTRIEDNVPVSAGSKNGSYRVFGVRPPWAGVRQFGAEKGEFLDDNDLQSSARVAIIGQTVARELFGSRSPLGEEISINQVPFRVKGVLVGKGASPAEGDRDARIVVPFTTFYDRLYKRQFIDQIVVQTRDAKPETMAAVDEQIKTILRQRHRIPSGEQDDFATRLPSKISEESRGISRNVFYLLLGIAVVCGVVAALVIVLVSSQTLRQRRGEIGIRRALGATPNDILQQIWTESLAVSLVGGLLGVLLGTGAAYGLATWRQLAFAVDARVVLAPLAIILLTSLAGLIPARSAAELDPAQALRPSA